MKTKNTLNEVYSMFARLGMGIVNEGVDNPNSDAIEPVSEKEDWAGNVILSYEHIPFNTDANGTIEFKCIRKGDDSYNVKNSPFMGHEPREIADLFNKLFATSGSLDSVKRRIQKYLATILETYQYNELDDIGNFNIDKPTKGGIVMMRNGENAYSNIADLSNDNIQMHMDDVLDRYNSAYDEHLTKDDVDFKYRLYK